MIEVDDNKRAQDLKSLFAGMLLSNPFFAMMLMKFSFIFYDADREKIFDSAFVYNYEIYISRKFWDSLTPEQRKFVVLHELFHVLYLHQQREEPILRYLKDEYDIDRNAIVHHIMNLLADAEINDVLMDFLGNIRYNLNLDVVTRDGINRLMGTSFEKETLEKMAVEVFRRLIKQACGDGCSGSKKADGKKMRELVGRYSKDNPRDLPEKEMAPKNANKVFEGELSKELQETKELQKAKAKIQDAVREVYVTLKTAGNISVKVEEWVKEFTKSEVDWCRVLRSELLPAFGLDVVRKYNRLSRRMVDVEDFLIPGTQWYGIENVFVGIDVSGSIGKKELQKFLSEVLAIVRDVQATVWLYQWDTEIVSVEKITSPVKEFKIRGRGGTCMAPFLKEVYKKKPEYIIIFSDFYLYDWEASEKLLQKIARHTNVILVSTTDEVNRLKGKLHAKIIRVEIKNGV